MRGINKENNSNYFTLKQYKHLKDYISNVFVSEDRLKHVGYSSIDQNINEHCRRVSLDNQLNYLG